MAEEKTKRFTYNISIERKNRVVNAAIEIISRSKKHILWFDVLNFIIDSYFNDVINDMEGKVKPSPSVIKKTYNVTSDRRDLLIEVGKQVSRKLHLSIKWSEVLTFMIDHYIDGAIDKLSEELSNPCANKY
jgi:hypothetical protein